MNTVIITKEADKEYSDSAIWYEEQSNGLGERFILTIQKKLELIQHNPESYPKKKDGLREAVVKIFPFVIIYSFHKKENLILVSSIFHTRRNPRKKYRKNNL